MVNDTQIVFQNFPVGPLEGVPDKYISTSSTRMLTEKRQAYTAMKETWS